ncbi:MAG: phosphoglucosamine mutase [Candidatus Nezhaarchaeales archaeon]
MSRDPILTLIVSQSGIRGVYGESLTIDLVIKLTKAFVKLWNVKSVIIGRDTRPSGNPIKHAVLTALTDLGCRVYDVEVQPTPLILWTCRKLGVDGAIIISASHNPPEWNALKLAFRGVFLDEDDVSKLVKANGGAMKGYESAHVHTLDPLRDYVNEALKHLDVETVKRRKIKVVIDPGGGAGFRSTPMLLRVLGCKVVTINSAPGVFSRDIEPTPSSLEMLSKAVKAYDADVGFAHDADANRLVCVTESGEVLYEDYGLAIASLHVLERRRGPLVVSVASSMMFKWIAEQFNVELFWSPIGEVNVVKEIVRRNAPIGGEGSSGGIIPAFFNLARDGVFGAALIIEALASRDCRISDIVDSLPRYYQARDSIYCEIGRAKAVMKKLMDELRGMQLDLTDGIKVWFDDGWVLIRQSRTEPKIRILCESTSQVRVRELLEEYVAKVRDVIFKSNVR